VYITIHRIFVGKFVGNIHMAHQIGKLSAVAVSKKKKPGLYGDGGGLSLQIAKGGSKSWIYRFMLNGKARSIP
jgi:hypothetical protein